MSIDEPRQEHPTLQIDHLDVGEAPQQVELADRLDPTTRHDDDAGSRTRVHRLDATSNERPSHPTLLEPFRARRS